MIELQRILCVSGMFSVLFLFSESLYASLNLQGETSRKLVHIVTGLISLTFPFIFNEFWEVTILCSGFIVILSLVEYKSLLPSITNINRKSSGSIYFPLSVIIAFGFYKITSHIDFYIYPIILLTICDPLAAILGKRYGKKEFGTAGNLKTYFGSAAFLISAFLLVLGLNIYMGSGFSLFTIIAISIITTLAEAFSKNGADNLFIPLVCIVLLASF